jgi:hypothetical protein
MGIWRGEFGETLLLQKHDRHALHGHGAYRFHENADSTPL